MGLATLARATKRAAYHWLFEISTISLELFSAAESLLLGSFLILPIETFGTSPTYIVVTRIASEATWGAAFVAVGAIQFYALSRNYRPLRKVGSLAASCVYGVWAVSLLLGNPNSTGFVTYALISLAMLWAYVNQDAKT